MAVVLVVSVVMVFRTKADYAKGASTYEEAEVMAKLPKLIAVPIPAVRREGEEAVDIDPNLALLAEVDLDGLRQENPDVLGWISIPETGISYPLLQGKDNSYYLKHTWQKNSNKVGAIFMDYRSNADLTDFHTILYGHRMRDGSMFARLQDYDDQEHWRTHPSIYLAWNGGVYRYDIFAAYEASVNGHVYNMVERNAEGREEFISLCLEQSVIESDIVPTVDDNILTLSTCPSYGFETRWVVQGILAEFYPTSEDASGVGDVA